MVPYLEDDNSSQKILNSIAGMLVDAAINNSTKLNKLFPVAESMIDLYNSIILSGGNKAEINLLKGIDWDSSKITDYDLLIETSDDQVESAQSDSMSKTLVLLSKMQQYQSLNKEIPPELYDEKAVQALLCQSCGYKIIDRKMTVTCEEYRDLVMISDCHSSMMSDWSTYVDFNHNGTQSLEIYYPNHMQKEILAEIENVQSSSTPIKIESIETVFPSIPGCKDVSDLERKQSIKEEMNKDSENSM